MTRLSMVCQARRAAQATAGTVHTPCTGCDCTCHHVRAPRAFRALVDALRPTTAPSPAGRAGEGPGGPAAEHHTEQEASQ